MSDRATPPSSPDGLGERATVERLRSEEDGWAAMERQSGVQVLHDTMLSRDEVRAILDRIDTLTEQVREAERERERALQMYAGLARTPVGLMRSERDEARSENARLTEQVREAEGVVEAARKLVQRFGVPHDGHEDEDAIAALGVALSIYDEGAGKKP